jgi:predicted house-cleaning NTP pyrophosphatase (Maf/HAM1 superfamily)|tara:strand:+ start:667 stop:921 length:255 start_codon:yes stop_codon:yes gene_type:complete
MIDTATGKSISRVIKTELFMRELTEPEINKYLEQDPNFNIYALGYDPLSYYSSTFVKKIEGSYNNFTRGIPLEVMVEMLKGFEK